MVELFTLCPLFPGSSEADEIYKVCIVVGSQYALMWAVQHGIQGPCEHEHCYSSNVTGV